MSKKLQQIQAKARELALSGTFIGWRPIAFTLQLGRLCGSVRLDIQPLDPRRTRLVFAGTRGDVFIVIANKRYNGIYAGRDPCSPQTQ